MSESENKTERVQLLMAPTEVEAIDEWGFKNRIRTRAEAMRRLCQLGLELDQFIPALSQHIGKTLRSIEDLLAKTVDIEKLEAENEVEFALRLIAATNSHANPQMEFVRQIMPMIALLEQLVDTCRPLINAKDFDAATKEANDVRLRPLFEELERSKERWSESKGAD